MIVASTLMIVLILVGMYLLKASILDIMEKCESNVCSCILSHSLYYNFNWRKVKITIFSGLDWSITMLYCHQIWMKRKMWSWKNLNCYSTKLQRTYFWIWWLGYLLQNQKRQRKKARSKVYLQTKNCDFCHKSGNKI